MIEHTADVLGTIRRVEDDLRMAHAMLRDL